MRRGPSHARAEKYSNVALLPVIQLHGHACWCCLRSHASVTIQTFHEFCTSASRRTQYGNQLMNSCIQRIPCTRVARTVQQGVHIYLICIHIRSVALLSRNLKSLGSASVDAIAAWAATITVRGVGRYLLTTGWVC